MRKAFGLWVRAVLIIGIALSVGSCDLISQLLGLKSGAKDITSFSLESLSVTAILDPSARTISITVPYGTDLKHLIPVFTTDAASVSVHGIPEVSGTTEIDFTQPVTITVTAGDGSMDTWIVTITVQAPSSDATLSSAVLTDSSSATYSFVPAFDPTTYDYTAVPVILTSSDTYTLTLTTADPHATIFGVTEGKTVDSNIGTAYTLTLGAYSNTVMIVVTAQDGSTAQYSIAIQANWYQAQ
jgi:hypothetical protein